MSIHCVNQVNLLCTSLRVLSRIVEFHDECPRSLMPGLMLMVACHPWNGGDAGLCHSVSILQQGELVRVRLNNSCMANYIGEDTVIR
jgi:hypothetical protein